MENQLSNTKIPDISTFGPERFNDLDALIKSHLQLTRLAERAVLALEEDLFPMLRQDLRDALKQVEAVNLRWGG
jgi:hypothetical protein